MSDQLSLVDGVRDAMDDVVGGRGPKCFLRATIMAAALVVAFGLVHESDGAPAPVVAPTSTGWAQDVGGADGSTDTFEVLRGDYLALASWLRGKSSVGGDERREIETFRRRVDTLLSNEPDNPALVAMELQCAVWLDDSAAVDAAYATLARLRPGDPALAERRARPFVTKHRYADALAIIEEVTEPPPVLLLLKARCLNGLNRFSEAIEAVDAIALEDSAQQAAVEAVQVRDIAEKCATLWIEEEALRAAEAERDDLPRVAIETARGTIVIELFEDHAPNTVANFLALCRDDYYNGTRFHRVLPGFMAQGGDPNSRPDSSAEAGTGGPGYRIADEHTRPDRRNHFTGSVAMAKTAAPDTAGSQFYICFAPPVHLNGQHTVFGRVIEGMDAAMSLRPQDELVSAKVLRQREHEYEVEKITAPLPPPPIPQPPVRSPPITPAR